MPIFKPPLIAFTWTSKNRVLKLALYGLSAPTVALSDLRGFRFTTSAFTENSVNAALPCPFVRVQSVTRTTCMPSPNPDSQGINDRVETCALPWSLFPYDVSKMGSDLHWTYLIQLCCVFRVSHPLDAFFRPFPRELVSSHNRPWDSVFRGFPPPLASNALQPCLPLMPLSRTKSFDATSGI